MGLIRLRVKEFAAEKGWTIKEVSERSGVGTVQKRWESCTIWRKRSRSIYRLFFLIRNNSKGRRKKGRRKKEEW
jgi:hypothetical protein